MSYVNRRTLLAAAAAWPLTLCRLEARESLAADIISAARKLKTGASIRLLAPIGSEGNLQPIAVAFEQATGIKVELDLTPVDDINTRLFLAHMQRQSVDLALPATFGLPDLIESGVIQPLDDILPRAHIAMGGLYDAGNRVGGRRYGFQTDGDVYLMFYNRALLNDAALNAAYEDRFGAPLQAATTFAELDRNIEYMHAPDKNRYGGALFRTPTYIVWEWWIRLHAYGGLPFDHAMEPTLATEAGVRALEDMVRVSEFLTPDAATAGLVRNWQVFSRGNVFANIGWGGSQKYFMRDHQDLPQGVETALTPCGGHAEGGGEFAYFNWGWSYAVPQTSGNPKLAALFARYATLPETSVLAVRDQEGFFDPFHASHYQDETIRETYGTQFLAVHEKALRSALPDLYLRGRNSYVEVLSKQLIEAHQRRSSAFEALTAVESSWRQISERLGVDRQRSQWHALRATYPSWLV